MNNLAKLSQIFVTFNQESGQYKPVVLSKGQQEIFNTIVTRSHDRVHCMTPTQYGKLIADDVPVLTTKGWKNHGDLQVGDYVYNHKGEEVIIEGVAPKLYADREIEFSDGAKIQCHHNHEWIVKRGKWSKDKVVETKNISPLRYKEAKNIWTVPNIEPLKFKEQNLLIDPYTLGVWLGDGTASKPTITGDKKDRVIIDSLAYECTNENVHKITGCISYGFWKTDFKKHLDELKLIGNKHIPEIYKVSSIQQRLELLAGMIDTDGYVDKKGRVYITSVDKGLINDFVEIVRSLGMRTCIVEVKPTLSSSGIQGRRMTYVLGFQPLLKIPTVLDRKKVAPLKKKRKSISDIREIEPVSGNCIQVNGGVYLVGKELTPTHNSFTVAAAVSIRCATHPEKWAIIAPSTDKAMIIMRQIIENFTNCVPLKGLLDMEEKQKDKLRREISKKRIVLRNGAEIFILSADSNNKQAAGETLMGFGSPNIILDESSLIDDDIYSKVKRMLGGHSNNFLFEIGNPFKRNHFLRSYRNTDYKKIVIDWKQAVEEGRLKQKFIDEMRKEAFFGVLYDVKFPEEDAVDVDGWSVLVTESELKRAFRNAKPDTIGERRLGVDIARSGGNFNVWVLRHGSYAEVLAKTTTGNLMEVVGLTRTFANKHEVDEQNIFIDATGLGSGVYDRFLELGWSVTGINMSEKAVNDDKYINIRAEAYFRLRDWILQGGMLQDNNDFYQLTDIKFKVRDSSGKFKIIDKLSLAKNGIPSPDVADALMLTFGREDEVRKFQEDKIRKQKTLLQPKYI